jgi:DNA-binding NarL/FixJ family response regulator
MNINQNIPTIAIVSNQVLFRQVLIDLLSLQGFDVRLIADDGKSLLNCLSAATQLPNICLLDIDMPIMNGFAAIRRIRIQFPSVKIVAMTFRIDEEKKAEVLLAGADTVLKKESDADVWKEILIKTFEAMRS